MNYAMPPMTHATDKQDKQNNADAVYECLLPRRTQAGVLFLAIKYAAFFFFFLSSSRTITMTRNGNTTQNMPQVVNSSPLPCINHLRHSKNTTQANTRQQDEDAIVLRSNEICGDMQSIMYVCCFVCIFLLLFDSSAIPKRHTSHVRLQPR